MNENALKLAGKQIDDLLLILKIDKNVKGDAAVFFDIDGTINRDDCLEILISEIVRRDLIPSDKEAIFRKAKNLWKCRELSFEDYLKTVIELIAYLKSFSYEMLERIIGDLIRTRGARYYLFSWLFLLKLKTLGYKLIALSGAPDFMAKMYLNEVGIFPSEIHASKYLFEKGLFTGKVDLSILKNKGEFIEKTYGKSLDLKKCIALGDTIPDTNMFYKVGKAIAINPTHELAILAKEKKWTIVVERKDLILSFPSGQFEV